MDISKVTDLKELKAMVYDESVKMQDCQSNIELLNQRIAELAIPPKSSK